MKAALTREQIDALEWADEISFVSYGVAVGIQVSDAIVMDRLPDLLPPGWKPARSPKTDRVYSLLVAGRGERPEHPHKRAMSTRTRRIRHTSAGGHVRPYHLLFEDTKVLSRTKSLEHALAMLESTMRLYVAEQARNRLFVHAGMVGWRGQGIMIPGRTLSGKSTLVNELVKAGATYYSDEFAVCDSQGLVHPYPKPITLREHGKFHRVRVAEEPVAGVGGRRRGVKPLRVGLIGLTKYRAGARWRPRQLSPGLSVMALLNQTVSARQQSQSALAILRRVVADALVLEGVRGEAREMADCLLEKANEQAARIAGG